MVPFLLLWWTFRQVSFEQVWGTIRQVNILQLALWLLLNIGLVTMMTMLFGATGISAATYLALPDRDRAGA